MADSLTVKAFLVVKADGDIRVVRGVRGVRLKLDEIAFPLTVSIPRQWGKVQATSIELTMPEPPEAWVQVGDGEGPATEAGE